MAIGRIQLEVPAGPQPGWKGGTLLTVILGWMARRAHLKARASGEVTEQGPTLFSVFPKQVAMKHPSAVTACNLDLENLVTDSNRSIATLAITTLLKTGSESSIDRLMKQISSFMSEISDEFKVSGFSEHHLWPPEEGRGPAVHICHP